MSQYANISSGEESVSHWDINKTSSKIIDLCGVCMSVMSFCTVEQIRRDT